MINCLLCNLKLDFVIEQHESSPLVSDYGYLCADCKTSVLRVGKNQIDHLNQMADTTKAIRDLRGLPLGAFGYGDNAFPADLIQQQRQYNDTPSLMREGFKPEPVSPYKVKRDRKYPTDEYPNYAADEESDNESK